MPHYKLIYFTYNGRGEPIRMLFKVAGVPFEDVRVNKETEWPALKPTTPFGFLPVLEVDGKPIPETNAILRYLGNEFGLAGSTPLERAMVDAVVDQHWDYVRGMQPWLTVAIGYAEGDEAALFKDVWLPLRAHNFAIFEKLLKENGSGWLVGPSITFLDILMATRMELVRKNIKQPEKLFEGFPHMEAHFKKVFDHPKIKEHVANRPPAPF